MSSLSPGLRKAFKYNWTGFGYLDKSNVPCNIWSCVCSFVKVSIQKSEVNGVPCDWPKCFFKHSSDNRSTDSLLLTISHSSTSCPFAICTRSQMKSMFRMSKSGRRLVSSSYADREGTNTYVNPPANLPLSASLIRAASRFCFSICLSIFTTLSFSRPGLSRKNCSAHSSKCCSRSLMSSLLASLLSRLATLSCLKSEVIIGVARLNDNRILSLRIWPFIRRSCFTALESFFE